MWMRILSNGLPVVCTVLRLPTGGSKPINLCCSSVHQQPFVQTRLHFWKGREKRVLFAWSDKLLAGIS